MIAYDKVPDRFLLLSHVTPRSQAKVVFSCTSPIYEKKARNEQICPFKFRASWSHASGQQSAAKVLEDVIIRGWGAKGSHACAPSQVQKENVVLPASAAVQLGSLRNAEA